MKRTLCSGSYPGPLRSVALHKWTPGTLTLNLYVSKAWASCNPGNMHSLVALKRELVSCLVTNAGEAAKNPY